MGVKLELVERGKNPTLGVALDGFLEIVEPGLCVRAGAVEFAQRVCHGLGVVFVESARPRPGRMREGMRRRVGWG
jgi:hypothetical protein